MPKHTTKKTTKKPTSRTTPSPKKIPRPNTTPPPSEPEKNTTLLAITGMSPAILTETIWALAQPTDRNTPPVIPHRIIVLTTTQGRDRLASLFQPSKQLQAATPWDALRTALQACGHDLTGRLRFGETPDDIRVITTSDPHTNRTQELPDIRNLRDNQATADFFLEHIRAIVENPDTHLIVSLAGGRKTMSALLYACLTLLGRETDRITHVLVNEPFETLRDFWFPAQPGGPIPVPHNTTKAHPAHATIQLADIPFIPLRNLFHRELNSRPGTFHHLIETCRTTIRQQATQHLQLTLDTARSQLLLNGHTFRLTAAEMLITLLFAHRAKQNAAPYQGYKLAVDDLETLRFTLAKQKNTSDFNDWRHTLQQKPYNDSSETERLITRTLSDLRNKLRRAGQPYTLLASALPERGRCYLDLTPEQITINPELPTPNSQLPTPNS